MNRASIGTFGLLLAALVAVAPCRAEAQLGDLKKRVKEAVRGTEQTEARQAAGQPNFSADVVEITASVLEGFVRGLRTEIALQKELRDVLAKYPTKEQFEACQLQAAQSEEAQRLIEKMSVPDNASPAEAQRIMTKLGADLDSLSRRKCPLDPTEWDATKRAERLNQIDLKAAEATGLALSAPLTPRAYSILEERVVAFCASKLVSQNVDPTAKQVGFPGSGAGIHWAYTPDEAKLLQGRCKVLTALISQLMR